MDITLLIVILICVVFFACSLLAGRISSFQSKRENESSDKDNK